MAWYRLKAGIERSDARERAEWLKEGEKYYGFALLSAWQKPKVRLYHPQGGGAADVPRAQVEACPEAREPLLTPQ